MFFRKKRRSGVSLAEAMIMVIVAGSLMVPVIGTLQQGIDRTNSLELRTALQNLAESKMAEVSYYSLKEGQKPTGGLYVASYPNDLNPEYQMTVRVEVLSDPVIVDDNTAFTGHIHPDFSAVSIVASVTGSLIGEVPDVEPVTLMTMLCPPPPPPDFVYAAMPAAQKIALINPMVPSLITEIPVAPETPMHLAVHPSGKYLAIKTPTKVLMMDTTSHSFSTIYSNAAICISSTSETGEGNNNARLDRGMVFRSDGKYLYLTNCGANRLVVLEATGGPTDPWNATNIVIPTAGKNDLRLLDDGSLVFASAGATSNQLLKINTHTNTTETVFLAGADPSVSTNLQLALTGEWGGNNFYARLGNKRIARTNIHSPTEYLTGQIGGSFTDFTDARSHNLLMSFDNRWLFAAIAYDSTGASTQRIAAFKLSEYGMELTSTTNSKLVERGNTGGDSSRPISQIEYSPYREQLILKTTDKKLMFPSISALTSGAYTLTNDIPGNLVLSSGISDVKARVAEYAWVACSDTASHTLEVIDIYSGNSSTMGDLTIDLVNAPRGIALNASGHHGAYCEDVVGSKVEKISVADYASVHFPSGLNFPADATPVKPAFLLDGSLITLTEKNDCSCHKTGDCFPGPGGMNWDDMHNGFLLYEADANGSPVGIPCLGFTARSESTGDGFRVRDLAVMHRRSGAYVLLSREDQTDSILLWIEKSSFPGYSPQQSGASYRIMGYWRTLFDGFPTKSARRLALSADDTVLAIYDNKGNGSKQAIYFYDLTNNHFPTTAGLIYNRYKDGSVPSANGAVSNSYYDAQLNDKWSGTSAIASLTPGNILTASTTLETDVKFTGKYPADFNWDVGSSDDIYYALSGYFYHDSAANFIGFKSHDAARLAKDGYYPYRFAATRQDWYDDATTDNYAAYSYLAGPGSSSVQFDMFSDDGNMGANFAYASANAAFAPAWSAIASMPAQMFRSYKFKPFLIRELLMNGVDTVDYAAPDLSPMAGDALEICFSRDSAIPTLFFVTVSSPQLNAFDVFDIKLKKSDTNKLNENLTAHIAVASDMEISPDGRRLLIAGRDSGDNGKVLMTSLAYDPANPGSLAEATNWTVVSTQEPPRFIAVRPFNGFTSFRNSYANHATIVKGYGSHRAAVASGGIYVFGGANGVEEEPNSDAIVKVLSTGGAQTLTATLTSKLKDFAAVPFEEERILLLGGHAPGPTPLSSVSSFDTRKGKFVQDARADINSDNNSEKSKLRAHAAAATPYGPVIIGGVKGDVSTGNSTIVMNPTWTLPPGSLNTSDGAYISNPYLVLGDGPAGTGGGSFFLADKIDINDKTSFITSFTATLFKKDGITFCVQNSGPSPIGAGNSGLCYDGIGNSLAVWIDTRGGNDGPPGANDSIDFVAPTYDGNRPGGVDGFSLTSYYTKFPSCGLGGNDAIAEQTSYWWVVYDGARNKLNVWVNTSSNNPETATWAVQDYPADLYALIGAGGSNSAYFGFTAANNANPGHLKIKDWSLKVWEKDPMTNVFNKTDFSSWPPSGFSFGGSNTPDQNSNMCRLTTSSITRHGYIWYDTPIDLTNLGSFRVRFSAGLWTNGSNGMAFVIHGNGTGQSSTNNSGGLGYDGISNSIGVELDTYDSGGPHDSDANHMAIHRNGACTTPLSYCDPGWNIDDSSSRFNWVWVEYDSPARNLRVFADTVSDTSTPSQPGTPIMNIVLANDMQTMMGGTNAWIGFTARTANTGMEHNLAQWLYDKSQIAATVGGITDEVKTYLPNTISGNVDDIAGMFNWNGSATHDITKNVIQLTSSTAPASVGTVYTSSSLPITDNTTFSTHFVLRTQGATPADGYAFVVQNQSNTAMGGFGGALGYSSVSPSLAVEVDLYDNTLDGVNDISNNHIAIHQNGDIVNPFTAGAEANITGFSMHDNQEKYVWIDFDGSIMKIYINNNHVKPASPLLSQAVGGLSTFLGGDTSAFFGLSSGAGGLQTDHYILKWDLIVDNKMIVQFPPKGETLGNKPLPAPMRDGTAVTHYSRKYGKYFLYYIGGGTALNTQPAELIHKYDFDTGNWTPISISGAGVHINFSDANSVSQINQRTQVAACSWGDEIFIFGGFKNGSADPTPTAIAYHPDTGRFRRLTDLTQFSVSSAAVPYGPYIFLIGGSSVENGTTGALTSVIRYKP